MRKWVKRILAALGILCLVLFLGVYFGGRWAAQKYLARELAVGQGRVRLVDPEFRWSLDLKADSVLYRSPGLNADAGRTLVSANLFKSLIRFSPSVTLDVDTLNLSLVPGPDTAATKPPGDSAITFPEFEIPAAVSIRAGRISVADTGGPLVRADGVDLETRGPKSAVLSIREAVARHTGALEQSVSLSVSWEDSLRLQARLLWKQAGDSISLAARLQKADLMRGEADLRVHMDSSAPYVRALGLAPGLPRAGGLDADFRASLDRAIRLAGSLDATLDGFSDSAAYKLGRQKAAFRIDFRDSAGTWSLASAGSRGEDVDLGGSLFLNGTDSLADPAYLARHAGVTAKGHVRGISVETAGKAMRADLSVRELRASSAALRAAIVTGDGSRIEADLRREAGRPAPVQRAANSVASAKAPGKTAKGRVAAAPPPVPDWRGTFSAEFGPGERWVAAFLDTNVVFRKVSLRGEMGGGKVRAVSEAYGLKAYGLLADSLRLTHRYSASGYVLEPSRLHWNGIAWDLSGEVRLAAPGRPMSFRMSNPEFGSAAYAMPRADVMEAQVRDLAVEKLPYQGLDTLGGNAPRITADFAWDKRAQTGKAEVKATGNYKGEGLRARARAEWTREYLEIGEVVAAMAGSEITASARLRLGGRQFYEVAKLGLDDYEKVALGSDRFDIAKALAVAIPEPPIASGEAAGRFGYAAGSGFEGTYRFKNIKLSGEEQKFSIKELALAGKGDTLILTAVTESAAEPFFNDSATVALAGVLRKEQTLEVRARIGPKVFLDFQGRLLEFKELRGRLGIRGDAVLPGSSGELRGVRVRADLAFPFQGGLDGLSLEGDTLRLDYLVAGLDTQTISAPVRMQGGKITVPRISLRSRGGAELKGAFEFDPASRRMAGTLAGNSLAAQFGKGDRIKLNDIDVEMRADSTTLNLRASIGSGSAEHVKAPLRAAGDFSRVAVIYRAPMGKAPAVPGGGGRIPYLRVDATLDTSEIRYRLRSMETLQNLFKKNPEKRAVKRSNPMQVEINLETAGTGNVIETDILRLSYVGNFSMAGTLPYTLVQGRISSHKGQLGTKNQAYTIRRMDVKWLNSPMEEGEVELEAAKRLARNCERGTTDSCNITTRLTGELSDIQFTYDSDCQGAGGAGVEVAALIYSMRRGCYSSAFSAGGSGLSYEEQALGLLEPVASQYLTDAAGKLSGHWISEARISGLGALASDRRESGAADQDGMGATSDAAQEAIALEILSKEFWRTRLRISTAYAPENTQASSPWNYRLGLEWRPPLTGLFEDPVWKNRIRNNVNVEAALFTDPDRTQEDRADEGLRKRLGLNYTYDFWGGLWGKRGPPRAPAGGSGSRPRETGGKTAAAPDSTR